MSHKFQTLLLFVRFHAQKQPEFITLVAKGDQMLGKPLILLLFPNLFNKFNKT